MTYVQKGQYWRVLLYNQGMKRLLIALLLLAGCAPTVYNHPTKTEAEFNQDNYDCKGVAKQRTSDAGYAGNIFIESDHYKECMEVKYGWSPSGQS